MKSIPSSQLASLGAATPEPKRNKYGAIPTIYGGIRYDSKAEAARAAELDMLVAAGEFAWWIRQPVFRLGCPENKYVADFLVVSTLIKGLNFPGHIHIEDVKGKRTAKFNRDVKLWRAYGPCPLRLITSGKTVEIIEGESNA